MRGDNMINWLFVSFLVTFFIMELVFVPINANNLSDEIILINEDFEDDSYEDDWFIKIVKGDRAWSKANYAENTYVQMSGFKAVEEELEAYLISPVIDFDSYDNEVLSFRTKNGYYRGNTLTVWVSNNFDGTNVTSATWTELQVNIDESDNANSYGSVFVESGSIDLSTYSGKGYVAFKYVGNNTTLTSTYQVDDVLVKGVAKNFAGTLVSNLLNDKIDFSHTLVGEESDVVTYTLSYLDVSGELSITSPAEYLISLDGIDWRNQLIFNTVLGDGILDVKIKYVPHIAHYLAEEAIVEHKVVDALPYQITVKSADFRVRQDASTLSKEKTLDVVTWNLEFFGISSKGTSSQAAFSTKLVSVANKIIELDADVYAIQEVVGDDYHGHFLPPLIDKLNELIGEDRYTGTVAPAYSMYFNTPSADFPGQRICFIYNNKSVSNLESFSMFSDFYDGYSTPDIAGYPFNNNLFWSSGRLPQMMKAIVLINGKSQLINFVNIHAKCCNNGAERRLADANYLLNELVSNYGDDNIVVLGDYNEDYSAIAGAYAAWYSDVNTDFLHTTGSVLDHVSVSNELYDEYYSLFNNTQKDEVDQGISDHDPVMMRMLIDSEKDAQTVALSPVVEVELGNTVQLVASASSGLPVKYLVVSGNATISDDLLEVKGRGTIMVQAVQEGSEQYAPAFSELVTIAVSKTQQVISFSDIEDITFDNKTLELVATASSDLNVLFEVVSGKGSIEGNILTFIGVGEITIKAVQQGNEDYEGADEINVSFNILKGNQAITFEPIATQKLGEIPFELTATSSSGLPVSYEVINGGITIEGSVVSMVEAGEASIRAIQSGNENYNPTEKVQTFTIEEKNGVEEEYARQVCIYPNPGSKKVIVSMPDLGNKIIQIISMSGKTLNEYSFFGNEKDVFVSDLPNGIYFVKITSGNISIVKKLQVRH